MSRYHSKSNLWYYRISGQIRISLPATRNRAQSKIVTIVRRHSHYQEFSFLMDQSNRRTILRLELRENRNKVMFFIKWTLWKKIKYQIIRQMYPQTRMSHHQLLRLYNSKIKLFIAVQKSERNIFFIYGFLHSTSPRQTVQY